MSLYTETILPPRQARALPRWLVAALIVLALHIGIGAYLILTRQIGMPPGEPPDALMIDLGPVSASPPQPQQEVQHETVPEEPAVMSKPLPPQPPVPNILQTPIVPQAEAVLPSPPKPVQQKKIEEQKPQKVEKEKREQRAERAHPAREVARHATAPAPGFSGQALASWESEVRARVYTAATRSAHGSGTATLSFGVDSSGRVAGAHIARSSGSSELDSATLAIASRLGQLPPPPGGRRTTVLVPVRYSFH